VKDSTHMGFMGFMRTMAASPDLMNLGINTTDNTRVQIAVRLQLQTTIAVGSDNAADHQANGRDGKYNGEGEENGGFKQQKSGKSGINHK